MKTRHFFNTGRSVSEIGLGCWQLGADWGHVSDNEALRILETAVESGITFLDTDDVYGGGRSESLIHQFEEGPWKTCSDHCGHYLPPIRLRLRARLD